MDNSDKQLLLKGKIILISILIGGGIVIVSIGSYHFSLEPSVKKSFIFPADFYVDNKKYALDITYQATNGLLPYRNTNPFISVTFQESIVNSSNISLLFLNGRLMNDDDVPAQAREGKPASFTFEKTTIAGSQYISNPYLIYYSPGLYDATLSIQLHDGTVIEEDFENVVDIDSWDAYIAEKRNFDSVGLAWLVIGIGLITISATFTKIIDLSYEYIQLKKDKIKKKL